MLSDTGIDDVKKQRNAEYAKHINDPVLSSLKMEGIRLLFILFCTMTNICTIISQNITLLHISTLSYNPHGVCNQYLAKLHEYIKCTCW
jgi:hypothetical protein